MTRNELIKLWAKVTGKFDALIAGAPEALDTLKEIADKLNDDDDALAGLLSEVAGKADAPLVISGINLPNGYEITKRDFDAAITAHNAHRQVYLAEGFNVILIGVYLDAQYKYLLFCGASYDGSPFASVYKYDRDDSTLTDDSRIAGESFDLQKKLTFDTAPTSGSSNPVTSDGLYTEFMNVHEILDGLAMNYAIVGVVDNNNRVTFYNAADIVGGDTTSPILPANVIKVLQRNTSFTIGLMKNNYIISRLHVGYLTYNDDDELRDGVVLIGSESVYPYTQSNGYTVVSVFAQGASYVHKSTLSELDNAPVASSDKLLSSGGVYTALQGKQDDRLLVTVTQSGTDLVADVAVSEIIQAISAGRDVLAVYGIGGRLTEYYKVESYNQQARTLVWGLVHGIGVKTLSQTGTSVTQESKTFAETSALQGKQDVSPITNAASGALTVNEYRDFGTVSALTVTLTGGTMANYDLYKFAFTCASDSTTLTLPSGVKLPVDMEMTMATGLRFECVIDYANCLTFNCWD